MSSGKQTAGSRIGTKKKIVFALIPLSLLVVLIYAGYAGYRSKLYYNDIKGAPQWDRRMVTLDRDLGYAVIPNSRGNMVIDGGRYPVLSCHDADGFRVALDHYEKSDDKRPLLLALGDSFTYGFGLEVEQSFTQLVADQLNGTAKNAGGNGYGLAQMLILARRHIPALKPDYVLVQYSPWVTARSVYPFAPTTFSTVPVPYFSVENLEFQMAPPLFGALETKLPISEYVVRGKSLGDFMSFFFRIGLPMRVYTDFNLQVYGAKRRLGLTPEPATSRFQVEMQVYNEIAELCRQNGSEMLVVAIPNWQGTTGITLDVVPAGVIVVLADRAMYKSLPDTSSQTFLANYAIHWGDHMNAHHNAAANRIIAAAVMEGINSIRQRDAAEGDSANLAPGGDASSFKGR